MSLNSDRETRRLDSGDRLRHATGVVLRLGLPIGGATVLFGALDFGLSGAQVLSWDFLGIASLTLVVAAGVSFCVGWHNWKSGSDQG